MEQQVRPFVKCAYPNCPESRHEFVYSLVKEEGWQHTITDGRQETYCPAHTQEEGSPYG